MGFRLLLAGVALVGMATTASAAVDHDKILLRDADGNFITSLTPGGNNAYSSKQTCGACHNGTTSSSEYGIAFGKTLLSYDEIERHSYHAQLAANEQRGWNNWNPDSSDPFRNGAGPIGKNWVQGPGHTGAW